jgi:hypothetical protein
VKTESSLSFDPLNEFFLPVGSFAWDPNVPTCKKHIESDKPKYFSSDSTITVHLLRVTSGTEASYGNALTCKHGYRLHAFRGVNRSAMPWFNLHREVVLNRDSALVPFSLPIGTPLTYSDPNYSQLVEELSGLASSPSQYDGPVFFDIDTDTDSALNHWLMESAVFLEYWDDLQDMHPGIKLVLNQPRGYKSSIITQFFQISEDRVVYKNLSPELVAQSGMANSLTYYPPLITLMDSTAPDIPFVEALWTKFIRRLRLISGVENPSPWLPQRVLLLPRGTKENNPFNNRFEPLIDQATSYAESHSTLPCGALVESYAYDTFLDMKDQVQLQAEAKVYLVAYGSAHFFNIGLSRNATILISNKLHWTHHLGFPYLALEQEFGQKYNRIIWLNGDESESQVFSILDAEYSSKGPLP